MSISYQCDHLRRNALPPTFASEQAELDHVDAKIRSLDQHMLQLTSLHQALLFRSRQLHNRLLSIQSLPFDILSYIFLELIDVGRHVYPDIDWYEKNIRQALVLCSVSSHFRNVAFSMSELWRRVPLRLTELVTLGEASALLRQCITLTPSVDLAVILPINEGDARLAFDVLLTPDITRKIKSFGVAEIWNDISPSIWIDKFRAFGSPMLNTLSVYLKQKPISPDIQMLTTVTRLHVYSSISEYSITVPLSVRHLLIDCIEAEVVLHLLHQCQNVVECDILEDSKYDISTTVNGPLPGPLFLPNLKRLASPGIVTMCHAIVQDLRPSSLEFLHLTTLKEDEFSGALLFCRNVSSTLTTLKMGIYVEQDTDDGFLQLCRISFPKLRKLVISSGYPLPILAQVLDSLEGELPDCKPNRFPSLESFVWCHGVVQCYELLDFLERPQLPKAFRIHIQLDRCDSSFAGKHLEEMLRDAIGSRQIEVTIRVIWRWFREVHRRGWPPRVTTEAGIFIG